METKLDKTLTQFNEALARNKVLREDIDNLRLERMNFDAIHRKMEKELEAKKREMSNIIEISNVAYEARDQAHNEIASLRAIGDKEQSAFDAEMRELAGILEYDRKMKEARMRNKLKAAELGLQFSEDGEESKLNKKGIKGNWGVDGGSKAIQVYEEAFTQIQEATGMTDIDDLVTSFIAAEDQNFSSSTSSTSSTRRRRSWGDRRGPPLGDSQVLRERFHRRRAAKEDGEGARAQDQPHRRQHRAVRETHRSHRARRQRHPRGAQIHVRQARVRQRVQPRAPGRRGGDGFEHVDVPRGCGAARAGR